MSASPTGSTIFALATPAGRGAVAVVRLSGPGAGNVLERLSGARLPPPRRAVVRRLRATGGELVDEALILWMPAPGSFTGEDCAELHLHGGPAVISAVFDLLLATGLRMAEPGEFTRRAFQNGRLDLAQAEAIADLVESESGGQRRQALAQLGGALSRRYEGWRDALLDSLALLEAEIDFPDEEVPGGVGATAAPRISHVLSEIAEAAADVRGERVREGFRVALIGAPNVGKSSLLNALAQRDLAIVTDIPGTTRDVVETPINVEGQLLVLADTAGLRNTHERIEAEGVRRAQAWAASADLRLGVVDQTRPETWATISDQIRPQDMLVLNKSDLASSLAFGQGFTGLMVETVATGPGVMPLMGALAAWVRGRDEASEFPAITRSRHRELLVEAADHLARALDQLPRGAELGAEDVRLALRSLERVTGRTDPEAVLDRVFSTFCIGK